MQPDVYIVKNEWSQQINFDLNVVNRRSETIHLNNMELYVYDQAGNLIQLKTLRNGPSMPSIGTIPVREFKSNENITVFNPFTMFNPYIDLHRLKFVLSFKSDSGKRIKMETEVCPREYISQSEFVMPVKGTLFISDGNDLYANHRRLDLNNPLVSGLLDIHTNSEMFALDFSIIANKDLLPGNCVVIDHLNGEYSFLVHLKKGSVVVKEGGTVQKGQPVGEVGNSGSSMYPHLHYQVGNGPDYTGSAGLPIYFYDYHLISGGEKINSLVREVLLKPLNLRL